MAYIDVLNECVSKGLDKNLTHFYIAELWAATNKQRGNTKDFEEKIIKAFIDGELIAEASVTNPKALGGYEVIPYSTTILSQFENGFIGGSNGRRVEILQLYIARDNFKDWLIKSKQWPLANGCLLANWFIANTVRDDEANPNGRRDNQIYEICMAAKELGYVDLKNIPEGGKAKIKAECMKNTVLFTLDGFLKAWKEANKRGVIRMQDKEKYL